MYFTTYAGREYFWCIARFGTICTILKTWKTLMEECYFLGKLQAKTLQLYIK